MKRNRARARALLLIAGAGLAACATVAPAYGPIGPKSQFGYVDRVNPDGSHTVLVIAQSADMARSYWDQRAAELCGGSDFKKNIFRAERPIVRASGYAVNALNPAYGASYTYDTYGSFFMEGYLTCPAAAPADKPAPPAIEPPPQSPAPISPPPQR